MVIYSPDWTNIWFSFILLSVNLFRHPTLMEHGLYFDQLIFSVFVFVGASDHLPPADFLHTYCTLLTVTLRG